MTTRIGQFVFFIFVGEDNLWNNAVQQEAVQTVARHLTAVGSGYSRKA